RREINIVDHRDDRPAKIPDQTADRLHDINSMFHIEIIEWFIQQNIFGILRDDHCQKCELSLSAAYFIYVGIPDSRKIHHGDGILYFLMIFLIQSPLAMRKATETDDFGHF